MRLFKLILPVFFLFLTFSSLIANQWEFQFSIKSSGQFINQSISIYYYDSAGKKYIGCGGGSSLNYANWESSWNAIGNISGISGDEPNATFTISNYDQYAIVIGDQYVVVLNTYGDQTFYYHDGVLTTEGNNTVVDSGTWANYTIKLKNDFAGGGMFINSEWHPNIPLGGENITRATPTFPHEITAVDGLTGSDGYKRLWKIWSNSDTYMSQELSAAANYTSLEARFDKEFNLKFEAGGSMYILTGLQDRPAGPNMLESKIQYQLMVITTLQMDWTIHLPIGQVVVKHFQAPYKQQTPKPIQLITQLSQPTAANMPAQAQALVIRLKLPGRIIQTRP